MFWGSFSKTEKGPCVVWEKLWGSMTSESYCERILPLIRHEMDLKPHLILMQDNAPCHKAARTMREFDRLRINYMIWPALSPDLNPIESLWNTMKDHIAMRCREEGRDPSGQGRRRPISFQRLSEITQEAWERITHFEMLNLIQSMPRRCQAVIDADGGHIPY